MSKATTISKKVTGGEDLVVIPKKEYEQLQEQVFELHDAVRKIQRGESDYLRGRTKKIASLSDLD
jgi:PHD/YefM family antitoxin component YafN of YafNO toxin-antitoxin module